MNDGAISFGSKWEAPSLIGANLTNLAGYSAEPLVTEIRGSGCGQNGA